MERSQLTWEDVSQYEEIKGYGQQVWKHQGEYYLVTNEGGIAEQRVVYELPYDLFQLLEQGKRNLGEIAFKLQDGYWPPTEEEKRESEKQFVEKGLTPLIANPKSRDLFTQEELRKLIPIAEQKWIDWKGKLPDDYISPLK
ncbi:TPA: hypothetical protein TUM56_001518 [Streptococcus equi subsp. zooepidemicus]|uniref:Uncharacterized protein n=5 Tax=Streptococcus equi TaxID=1336 RepID=C0MFG3_STRS7|nr:hypothetical protein [Streptococcus equi]KIS19184.1 hypothetical protein AT55_01038 [Streptococcus equi subsp. zooepidemicus Sz4is]HEL1012545.1 hypothetical protein [Streptococcus equi subsp. ruminatorum]AEJ24466.1 conserved hypothetical protein [Streptococcus equi subsp. zooepidemicus ATCC 35246]AIA68157.1 hypothetical protein Q426_08055 [Streptococcus equi subsp. zooepidemicus CY]KDE02029.1 hypothetical protein M837_01961 [Streptococcus equi subsp. zooepidemicus SzS31A1]